MGIRAIRICLKRKDVFKTQLRALLRVAAYGNILVMYPMILYSIRWRLTGGGHEPEGYFSEDRPRRTVRGRSVVAEGQKSD